jgi:poly(3-hydroxybutyrate) depolymerase
MREIMEQFTALHWTDQDPDEVTMLKGKHRRTLYRDAQGRPVVTTFEIADMGHAIAVDPGSGDDQGGAPGFYIKAPGLFSSYHALVGWGLLDRGVGRSSP